jgi:LacI family repressor for deo operon, udp, cdd, tsx, nupC, and nupG
MLRYPAERVMNRSMSAFDEGYRRRRPTIADVARRAGVSPAAVSFAVNGRPGVGEQTRTRILQAAKELGWRPSASARALTEAKSRAIGLVLARGTQELEVDSFFVRFLSGVERMLAPAEYALLLQLVPAAGASNTLGAYERLAPAGRVDGFLITDPELDDPRFPLLERAGLPVVVAGRPAPDSSFPWLETDHDRGAITAVEHLVGLGHERIAFLGGFAAYEHVQRRLARWREALCAAGFEPGPVAFASRDPDAAVWAVLEGQPTAAVCTSDTLALALVAAARSRGLIVPDDLSVTGFDDSLLAALSSPALTSVRVDYAEFGAAATAALLAVLNGEPVTPYEPSVPVLEVRESTSSPRPQANRMRKECSSHTMGRTQLPFQGGHR